MNFRYLLKVGDKFPYRVKFRSPSMAAVSVMLLIYQKEKKAELYLSLVQWIMWFSTSTVDSDFRNELIYLNFLINKLTNNCLQMIIGMQILFESMKHLEIYVVKLFQPLELTGNDQRCR